MLPPTPESESRMDEQPINEPILVESILLTQTQQPGPFKCHRRGHSYAGVSNNHHHHLEYRGSQAGQGQGPDHGQIVQIQSGKFPKGHRRTLSGCMPMAMGVVAWSSLRELQSSTVSRPKSPEELKPMTPEPIEESNQQCSLGPFKLPQNFNNFANIKFFVGILSLLVTFQQAVASGYVNSVITTIETRFEIPSKYTGLVASAYEMGNVGTVLFVSYLGAKRHIPRWIAIGVLVMVLGCTIFTLPHFLSPPNYNPQNSTKQRNNANQLCSNYKPKYEQYIERVLEPIQDPLDIADIKQELIECTEEPTSYSHPLILFMVGQLLLGCGGSPLFTLGITYIDDHVGKELSSVYIGLVYSCAAFGPVLGFLTGAWLLSIPSEVVDPLREASATTTQFIGLWWGGFLIAGVLLFIICLPFLTFPKFLDKLDDGPDESEELEKDYGQSIKDIPRSMWRLVTNPVYILTCLGGCMEMNIISGFIVFLPKYLETQFSLGKSEASLYTGGIAIPGACLGIFAGGFIMKKLELKPSGACRFVIFTNFLCLLGHFMFFFMGCGNPAVAGAVVSYEGRATPLAVVNLTSACNQNCQCDPSLDANYVCHGGITYFSPCHAGCGFNLTQCACAGGFNVEEGVCSSGEVEDGSQCNTLPYFMVILFFMTGTVAMTQMPLLMIILRSVSPTERSFALGMQFVIFRILGYIPSPILFGNVIDSSCLLWSSRQCSSHINGRCLTYDLVDFRYKYVGLLTGFKLMALSLFMLDFIQLKKFEKRDAADKVVVEVLERSEAIGEEGFEDNEDEKVEERLETCT